MYLRHTTDGKMVEVLSINDLINPSHADLVGRYHAGEELQDPETLPKDELVFLSGEALPRCWTDAHYRDSELRR